MKVRISADDMIGLMRYLIAQAKPKHLMADVRAFSRMAMLWCAVFYAVV